jgi:chromosomal replication initiation ATPase DnaA
MNDGQRNVYDAILNVINAHEENTSKYFPPFFVEGKPGRGKTYVVDAIVSNVRSRALIALVVASSGLSASLYERGRTAHKVFRIPVTDVSTQ